jgi:phage baseplate assembly protein W
MDIKFPLVENDISVFERADLVQTARQKLKNIVLTNPGERVMLPNFGVGIKRYLFSQNSNIGNIE